MDIARIPADLASRSALDGRENRFSERVWVWGVPFSPITVVESVDLIDQFIAVKSPTYVITANLHFTMLNYRDARLQAHSENAAIVLADGMPLVWASKWRNRRLPERVAGADLFPKLCKHASTRGHRIFLLGGKPGIAESAAEVLSTRYPGLTMVGIANPTISSLTNAEHDELLELIRRSRPDLLFVALGQPFGEYWVAENYQRIGAPVTIQVGASIDFVAGDIKRAPIWVQRGGFEWLYRLGQEPRRLFRRYSSNAWFAACRLVQDAFTRRGDRR